MFTTDGQCHIRPLRPAQIGPNAQQFAHAFGIQRMKRVFRENALLDIVRHEPPGIVTAEPVGHLRQVIGPKAEERRIGRNFIRPQAGARRFHHNAQP